MNDPQKVWAEIHALVFGDQHAKDADAAVAAGLERLHAAVTELGNKYVHEPQRAAHGETTTEWGVLWENEQFYLDPILRDSEAEARKLARTYAAEGARLVSRQVTHGPWIEVAE